MVWKAFASFLYCFSFFGASSGRPEEEKVTNLPGLNFQVRFNHYSGYLNAGEGSSYHYWFLESQSQPSTDPLFLFLNGGPGCSSMVALFAECGPFRIKGGAKQIVENPYAWTKLANMLFIESPAGAGFSYSTNPWNLSDEQSVLRHYDAMISFYGKFPEFRNRTLYLTGQSYAAVYLVTLAGKIVKTSHQFPGKLKGIAIGNGVFSKQAIINSRFYYNYYHGLLSEQQWRNVITECCQEQPEWKCNLFAGYTNASSKCYPLVEDALNVGAVGRDPYNINFECYQPSSEYLSDEECGAPFGNITKHYFDRHDVRVSAHIDVNRFRNYSFEACSAAVSANYSFQLADLDGPMNEIINSGIAILIFNGDFDSVANYIGTQWFVDGLNITKTGNRTPIFYSGITQQNVGYQQNYDGLDYLIIRGAGHYVPADRPRESLQIMANFIRGEHNYSIPYEGDTSPAPLLEHGANTNQSVSQSVIQYGLSESLHSGIGSTASSHLISSIALIVGILQFLF